MQLLVTLALALTLAGPTPEGTWKTIDDASKKPRSIVKITKDDAGVLTGTIIHIYPIAGQPDDPVCEQCEGALKDQPVDGMTILKGLTWDGKKWSGGTVLDPENGKTYKCFIELEGGGSKLKLRGFVGGPLLGRTQYWHRLDP